MVLISVGFIAGIGSATDKIDYSLDEYYTSQNVSDFIIKSKSLLGFNASQISWLKERYGEQNVNTGLSFDVQTDEEEKLSVRYYFLDFDNWTVNKPDLIEGTYPEDTSHCLVERESHVIKGYNIGDEIEVDLSSYNLSKITVKVSGIIQSPLTFAKDGTPSYNNDEELLDNISFTTSGTKDMDCLENIIYLSYDLAPRIPFVGSYVGDVFVALKDRTVFKGFSPEYEKLTDSEKGAIEDELGRDKIEVITLYQNYSFRSLSSYSSTVTDLGYVLMVAFLLVTALVTLSTMTRLIDEERPQIACLKTLGYSSFGIISKYLIFALIATGIGGVGAYFVGLGVAHLFYYVFNYSFVMPPISSQVAFVFYIINFALIVVATLAATAISGIKMTGEKPANLLRPKPPKAGKKVILEKIPIIWNRLSFKYKSTMRNVLRYKSRFFMTVIAVAFSLSLVMAGLSLLDLCLSHGFGSSAIVGVSTVVVVFAGLLTAVVIYTLTNINISERNREIATLMVLGYNDAEVAGYIYREVYINSSIGIAFGYPLAALLTWIVFKVMSVGVLGEVSWFMWLIAPAIVLAFTALVTLILRRKIIKIDMNESLKAIE